MNRVERNSHDDLKYFINDKLVAELRNGRQGLYSAIERGEFVGYTMILKRPHSSTWVHISDKNEALDTINNHIENYDKYVKQDEALGRYLSSDEGAWGRGS